MATTQHTTGVEVADQQHIDTSVVSPVYNEAGNLKPLVTDLVETLSDAACIGQFEILLVNDGSQDESGDRIYHLAQLFAEVRGVELARNYGQSAALAAGIDQARGRRIVTIDADGQNDPADIPGLVRRLEDGYDCVSGWRRERNDPWHKTIPSAIQTKLAKATGPSINDFGCTLTAYSSEALADLDLRGERHRYIPARLHRRGYRITEMEVNHHERTAGSSHYGAGRLIRGFVDLLYHLFHVRYRTRPMHVFGALGLAVFALGLLLGGWLLGERYLMSVPLSSQLPKLLLSVTLTIFGFGLIALGTVTELLTDILYKDERPYRIERVEN